MRVFLSFILVSVHGAAIAAVTPLPVLKAPSGFKVELVLQAPEIDAPSALAVAASGDVYIGENLLAMVGPRRQQPGRIWLLPGGDASKKVLVADRLNPVCGMELVLDKLFVVHAPVVTAFELKHDGTVKQRIDLFDDCGPALENGTPFTDHIPGGIRMGMDGWLYVSIGDRGLPKMNRVPIPRRPKKDDIWVEKQESIHVEEGRRRLSAKGQHLMLEGGGVIRFRPDGTGLEVFASGTRNHRDVVLDDNDRIFVRDSSDGLGWKSRLMYLPHGAFMGYPWAYKYKNRDFLPAIQTFDSGAPCGGWIYSDDGLPGKNRGRIFHCDAEKGNVVAVRVKPDGAGFQFVDEVVFLHAEGSGVKDFLPYALRPTADGKGFYVTDRTSRAALGKAKAGRLWKVTYVKDDTTPTARIKDRNNVDELLKGLNHPAHTERLFAQRTLATLPNREITRTLEKLANSTGSALSRRHALWALFQRDRQQGLKVAASLVTDNNQDVVRAAARIICEYSHETDRKTLESILSDLISLAPSNPTDLEKIAPDVRLPIAFALLRMSAYAGNSHGLTGDSYGVMALAFEKDPLFRHCFLAGLKQSEFYDFTHILLNFALRDPDWEAPSTNSLHVFHQSVIAYSSDQLSLKAIQTLKRFLDSTHADKRDLAALALTRVYKSRKSYAGEWWGLQPASNKPPPLEVDWEGTPVVREALLKLKDDANPAVRKAVQSVLNPMK